MPGINNVQILGRLGRDPELKHIGNDGTAVCNISIATSEVWKDKNSGEKKEKTEWHRIIFWRQLAEIAGKYLKKGDRAYIAGKLQTRKWDQDGVTRYATEIVADKLEMLGSKRNGNNNQPPPPQPPPDTTQNNNSRKDDKSDIPF